MIASLVIVLPTIHRGGTLILRHNGEEETFDTSRVSFEADSPREIHWMTFYSDIEHEILPVESGYRVTLTYNIYTVPKPYIPDLPVGRDLGSANAKHLSTLQDLFCRQEGFLPGGGLVGFGLSHKYAFKTGRGGLNVAVPPVNSIAGRLKGRDRELFALLTRMGFKASLKIVYFDSWIDHGWDAKDWDEVIPKALREKLDGMNVVLCDRFVDMPDCIERPETFSRYVMEAKSTYGATRSVVFDKLPAMVGEEEERFRGVFCVTPLQGSNEFFISYAKYGNEAGTGYRWGNIALIVDLPTFDKRQAMGN